MKTAADELPEFGLGLTSTLSGSQREPITQSACCKNGISFSTACRPGRAVRVHVADVIRVAGEFETFDQRAAFADGRGKIQPADRGKILRHALHHAERVVAATVEHDDQLKRAGIILPEKVRIFAQHRFDARFFVVSRDEEQQAWFGHGDSITESRPGNPS